MNLFWFILGIFLIFSTGYVLGDSHGRGKGYAFGVKIGELNCRKAKK